MNRLPLLLLSLLLLSALGGCFKEDELDNPKLEDYEGEFALPLFQSTTPIIDVLENVGTDAYAGVGTDSLVAIIYDGDVQGRDADDLIPDLSLGAIPLLANPFEFAIPADDFRLTLARFSEGQIQVTYFPQTTDSVQVDFTIENLQKAGQALSLSTLLPFNTEVTEDLQDYELIPEEDTIRFAYTATDLKTGEEIDLGLVTVEILDEHITYTEGYLFNQFYDLERDTVFIDLFQKWLSGGIDWVNPSITLFIDNSFGFPLQVQTQEFNVLTVEEPEKQAVDAPLLDTFDIVYPSLNEVGETKSMSLRIDPSNSSNIRPIINQGPLWVEYDLDSETNANAGDPELGFATDSSRLRVQVRVELPIYGNVKDFTTLDTVDLNFSNYEDATEAEFKLVTENEVPLDFRLQAYFLNADNQVIDSLLNAPEQVMRSAPTNEEGISSGVTTQTTYIPISPERFENIKDARRVLLESQFTSFEQPTGRIVRVFPEQEIRIRMGGIFKINGL